MHRSDCCLAPRKVAVESLNFTPATIEDKHWMDRIIRQEDSPSADFCFTSIFIWDEFFLQQVTSIENRLLVRLAYQGAPFYAYPVGEGDLESVICALCQDAAAFQVPLRLRGVTEKHRQELETIFPGQFEFTPDPNTFDYIYEVEKLASLAGKKLHAKRNHINRFIEANPDWVFEPITPENLPECVSMTQEWLRQHPNQASYTRELYALERAFGNYETLGLEGAVLRVKGEVIAYTVGERLNSDTYIIHFEKAFPSVQGAYPMINREFARYIQKTHPQLLYINREDDMGIESLQKAKRSYYPAFLLEKYTAVWRDT